MSKNIRVFEGIAPQITQDTFVDPSAVIIGDVQMGADCSVWPMVSIRGDVHEIRIGYGSNIQESSVIHVTHYGTEFSKDGFATHIGDYVTIGHKAMIHGCTIKDRSLIGMGSIVLDGAIIESDVMLGAGSLVPPGKTLESGFLYVGSPAKAVRKLTEREISFLKFSAAHYIEVKNRHLAQNYEPL